MSKTPPPMSADREDAIADKPTSPWVMIITMLLLISGFVLTSAMLLHYAGDQKGEEDRPSLLSMANILKTEKEQPQESGMSAEPERAAKPEKDTAGHGEDSMVKKLFSGKDDGSVRWPKLKLTGFGRSSDEEGAFAIINGKHVLVNTYIDDVKLVEVRAHGAVVEYRGEQKYLSVEQAR